MRKLLTLSLSFVAVAGIVLMGMLLLGGHGQAANGPRLISALGVANVHGERTFVHVTIAVAEGEDERAAGAAALAEQGARPATLADVQSANYATSGLVWDQFNDAITTNNLVVQNYNPAGDPTGVDGQDALTASEDTWTNVTSSTFAFQFGEVTNRCPSLVKECPGDQYYDANNDVGWLALPCRPARCTLGVTWYSTSIDEADMTLNSSVAWHAGSTSCANVSNAYDAQTVFTHENGHVVGLGHSSDPSALMYAYYSGAHCGLAQDDIDGITYLYPLLGGGGATATATLPAATATSTSAAPTATTTPSSFCPPGQGRKGLC